jgi:hypothetical protein
MKILKIFLLTAFAMTVCMACSDKEDTTEYTQEYYYWYKGEKIPLELMPTRKFILLASPDDTLALKNRLTEQNIFVYPFAVDPITEFQDKYIDKEIDCWTFIEGENLPDFTSDELILYEGSGFRAMNSTKLEVLSSHLFYVELFQADDFAVLQNLAAENNVTIRGKYMPLWYILECPKESVGSVKMANLFHETGLFGSATPGFYYSLEFYTYLGIASPSNVFSTLQIDTRNAANIIVDAKGNLIDSLQIFSVDGRKVFEYSYSNRSRVDVNMSNRRGVYIFRVTLRSGDIISQRTVIM